MNADHFRVTGLKVLEGARLQLPYADGQVFEIDIEVLAKRYKVLKPLLDPVVFQTGAIAQADGAVRWNQDDELELASDNLRARAIEQGGGYSHEYLWSWMHAHGFTLDAAASALGLSRRMIAYYRSGEKPLPVTVALACRGYDALAVKAA